PLHVVNSGEVYRFLTKPLEDVESFRLTLRQALEVHSLHARERELLQDLAKRNCELQRRQERIPYELRLAGQTQRRVLNTQPLLTADYEVRFAYHPSLSVGGDFFDAVSLPDGRICLYLGDVSGHGVAAALISTFLRVTASELVLSHIAKGPAEVCRALNRFMIDQHLRDDLFATFFIAVYDPKTRNWQACNCGHPAPLLLSVDRDRIKTIGEDSGDVPLGIMDRPGQYGQDAGVSWQSGADDVLLLFTDGLNESRHRQTQELCGMDSLITGASLMMQQSLDEPDPEHLFTWLEEQGYQLDGDDCWAISVRLVPDNKTLWRKTVSCDLVAVETAGSEIEQALSSAGWDEVDAGRVRLLFVEYGVNAVRYGGVSADPCLQGCVQSCQEGCVVLFRDSGGSWDYHGNLSRSGGAAPDAESGRGLEIIDAIAEKTSFFRWGRHNYARFLVRKQVGGDR
ncbi:MAG: hypothetical protein FJ220_03130, partial [Kiritimatiellaceae bacterium]|nr:hypothetical protein [Kiritimatiellaceae bacterium]